MESTVIFQLVALNRRFYDQFAGDFSRSRVRLQPGIVRGLAFLAGGEALVDVGCGDGRVGRALGAAGGEWVRYLGVDISAELVGQHEGLAGEQGLAMAFYIADITRPGWAASSPQRDFDAAVCLSVLHHIPGEAARRVVLEELGSLLRPGARVVVSVWQFLHLERFRRKVVPWAAIDLTSAQVEAGDVLLTWERGGLGYRYVHHFDADELANLLASCGYRVCDGYRSDGKTGDLGLYMLAEWGGG